MSSSWDTFFSLAVGGEARGTSSLRWPTPSDLNTRLRRIIAGYQRVVKKQELKKAAAEKVSTKTKVAKNKTKIAEEQEEEEEEKQKLIE